MEELSNLHLSSNTGLCALPWYLGLSETKPIFAPWARVSDVVNMGSKGRLGAWFLAIGIAILGVTVFVYSWTWLISDASVYLRT